MKRKIKMADYVFRGGSWFDDDPADLAASARLRSAPTFRRDNQGFRLVRTS